MSIENVKMFFERVSANEKLGKKLEKVNNELQGINTNVKNYKHIINTQIIPIAKDFGFDFTAKDFLDYVSKVSSELSEKDLLNVSGGLSANKSMAALGILLTFAPFAPNFATIAEGPHEPSASIVQTTNKESSNHYKNFKPSKIMSFMPTILGGKTTEEQEKDNLVNYLKENNITSIAQVPEQDLKWFDEAVQSVGEHLVENTINGTYYLEGTIPDENQINELNRIHKMYVAQGNKTEKEGAKNDTLTGTNSGASSDADAKINSSEEKSNESNGTLNVDAETDNDEKLLNDPEVSIDGNLKEQRGFLDNLMESLNQNPAKLKKVEDKKEEAKGDSKATAEEANKKTLSSDSVNLGTENNRNNERTEEITTSSETKSTTSGAKNAAETNDDTSKETIIDKTTTIEAGSKSTEPATPVNAESSSVMVTAESNLTEAIDSVNTETSAVEIATKSKSAKTTAPVNAEVNAKINPAEDNAKSKTAKIVSPALAASTTDQTSKNSNDKIKYFSATNEFKEWRDNGDSTVTATDLHEPGATYTFVRYNSSSALQEMIPNLISVIERIGNDTNRIWVEDRFNFLRDIRDFIGHTWNANTGRLEVEGISEDDTRLEQILNFWTNVLGKNPYVIFDVSEDLPLSEKMEETVKTIKRLDYVKNVNDPGKLISLVREIVCSKAYDTEDGTAKEWVNNASSKDKENFEFLENLYKEYNGSGKLLQYVKPGSLLDMNGLTKDAEKVINNWVKIGNSILSIDELYETDKSEFKRDAENIALHIQILLQDGDVYYGIPGVVPPKTIINFVNIYYNLGLSKNISYTPVNSSNLNLLSDNLGAANKEIGNNIFNLAKDDIVDYVKDWGKAQEQIKQHKASSGDNVNADSNKGASTGRAMQRLLAKQDKKK